MGVSVKHRHYLRRLALLSGIVVAGSTLPDMGRFFHDQGQSHNPLWAVLVLGGVALACCIGFIARRILRRTNE